jgi:hypothetical protein
LLRFCREPRKGNLVFSTVVPKGDSTNTKF